MRFLVSGVGGPAGKSLNAQLTAQGHSVVGCDLVPSEGFIEAPRADSLELIPFLQRTIEEHRIDVFIPTVQDELLAVSVAREMLDARVLISAPGPVGITADKWLTADFLRRKGIAVPATYNAGETPQFPVVVKPRVSRGGRGVEVVETEERFAQVADSSLIVQEFAPGEEFCPQLFISPSTGETDIVVLHKTKLKEGRVGNASAVERADDAAVADLARDTAAALGLVGPLDMDIRYTMHGNPVLLEVNARFGANSANTPEILAAFLEEVA